MFEHDEHSPPVPAEGVDVPAESPCKIGLPYEHTHEHVGWRRYQPLIGYGILIVGLIIALAMMSASIRQNRVLIAQNKTLIENVAKDCVDKDGDISYRNVLRGLIRMNHNRNPFTDKPLPANITLDQRRQLTADLLERGLAQAGELPECIADNP